MMPRERVAIRLKMYRLLVAGALVLLTLVTVRLAWGAVAAWRLSQAREALRAMAVFDQDVREKQELPEAENGAAALYAAVRVFDARGFRGSFGLNQGMLPAMWDMGWTPAERDNLKQIVTANAQAWTRLDGAGPQSVWTVLPDAMVAETGTVAERSRLMVDLLLTGALVYHLDGQDGEAVRLIQRVLTIEKIMTASPTTMAQSAAMLMRGRLVAMIERIAPTLKIAAAGGEPAAGAAGAPAVRAVIAGLLDDRAFHRQLSAALETQMAQTDAENWTAGGGVGGGELANWWLSPLKADERRRAMRSGAYWLPLARSGTFEPLRALPEFRRRAYDNLTTVVFAMSGNVDVQWNSLVRQHFRSLTDTRAAAVMLAARWAQVVEDGTAVGGEKLVPTYLPVAPVDPFAADGRPLRYRMDPEGATVWSVGSNGEDDGGALTMSPRTRAFDEPDLVYGAAWRVAITPATTP